MPGKKKSSSIKNPKTYEGLKRRRPVILPEGWEAIEVDQLSVRGQTAHLLARHGDTRATLELG